MCVAVAIVGATAGIVVASLGDVQRLSTAILAIVIAGSAIALGRKDFSRPHILLPIVWFSAVAVSQLNFFNYQTPWSSRTLTVVFAAPLAFAGAAWLTSRGASRPGTPIALPKPAESRLRALSLLLLLLGGLGLVLKIRILGTAPIFSDAIDTLRSAGGIRIPAYLTFLTNCFALAGWARTYRFFVGERAALLRIEDVLLVAVALAGIAASASRNALILALIVPLVFAYLVGAFRARRQWAMIVLAVGITVGIAIVAGLFFIRTAQHRDSAFESYFYRGVVPATPAPLRPFLPLQIGVAAPFETLNRVVRTTQRPGVDPAGTFSTPGIPNQLAFITGPRANFYSLTEKLSTPYYFNVATFAGPIYADFGLGGLVLACGLLGSVVGFARRRLLQISSVASLAAVAYLTYLIAFLLYENVLTFYTLSVGWDIGALFVIGFICVARTNPPATALYTNH